MVLTFDNLLCTRTVNLFLGRAGRQDSVEDIWLPLLKTKEKRGGRGENMLKV